MEKDFHVSIDQAILIMGRSHFVRAVAIPLSEQVEIIARDFKAPEPEDFFESGVGYGAQANLIELGGFAAIGIFLSGWAAKKVLDDLYEVTLRPRVRKVLDDFFRADRSGKLYASSISVRNRADKTVILIVSIGKNIQEIDTCDAIVPHVLEVAINNVNPINAGKTHTYIIEDGTFDSQPLVFNSRSSAIEFVSKQARPTRVSKSIGHDG